ncbi:hypothetical protein GBA52_026158 [Prunus armeniaca]|nr:hypothetical protein GBA52_026158 [Prunus armeniaca]
MRTRVCKLGLRLERLRKEKRGVEQVIWARVMGIWGMRTMAVKEDEKPTLRLEISVKSRAKRGWSGRRKQQQHK